MRNGFRELRFPLRPPANAFRRGPANRHGKARCDGEIPDEVEDLAPHKEAEFLRVNRMCLYFHYMLAGQGDDSMQSVCRFERGQGKQKVHKTVTPSKDAIHTLAIDTVDETLLSPPE